MPLDGGHQKDSQEIRLGLWMVLLETLAENVHSRQGSAGTMGADGPETEHGQGRTAIEIP